MLACHAAFVADFSALTIQEQHDTGLSLDDVPRPESLLELPQRFPHNALVANVHLYLIQLLRHIACTDPGASLSISTEAGILGFSTGMIAATVIACADTIPVFISHATEAFRLAFWLGLRAQQYAASALPEINLPDAASASWTLVTFGSTRDEVQQAVNRFNAENVCPFAFRLVITLLTDLHADVFTASLSHRRHQQNLRICLKPTRCSDHLPQRLPPRKHHPVPALRHPHTLPLPRARERQDSGAA